MLKINRKASTTLSFILAVLFLLVLVLAAIFIPYLAASVIPEDQTFPLLALNGRVVALVAGYVGIAIALFADITLLLLLHSVRRERIFTPYCVALLRRLSWFCMGEAIVFLAVGALFTLALFIAFIALLVGLCLRVVKNAFELAVALKEENDLTV